MRTKLHAKLFLHYFSSKGLLSALFFAIIPFTTHAQQVVNKGDAYYVLDLPYTEVIQRDTVLSFNNGSETFYCEVLHEHVPDTIIEIFGEPYHFQEDTLITFSHPNLNTMMVEYPEPYCDTLRDPDDPHVILYLDTIVQQKVQYAERHTFNTSTFYDTIKRIENLASTQGLDIIDIHFKSIYPPSPEQELEGIKFEELKEEYSFVILFTFGNEEYQMRYPILFTKE